MNVGYVLFVIGTIVLVLASLYQLAKGFRAWGWMRALDSRGVSAMAQILALQRHPARFGKAVDILVTYRYTPGGSTQNFQRDQWIGRPIEYKIVSTPGKQAKIRYLPDKPQFSMLVDEFRDTTERDAPLIAGAFMFIAAFWGGFFIIDQALLALVIFLGVFGVSFVLLGLFLLYGGFQRWQEVRRLNREGIRTQGLLLEKQINRSGRAGSVFTINYEYPARMPDGTTQRLYASQIVGGFSREMKPGEPIEVVYLADKPKVSMLSGNVKDNSGRFIMLWFGIILLPLGVFLLSMCLRLLRDL